MNTRYFSTLLPAMIGMSAFAVGCDSTSPSGSPTGDGGVVAQPGAGGSGNTNGAAGVDDASAGGGIDAAGATGAEATESGGAASTVTGSDGGGTNHAGNDGGTAVVGGGVMEGGTPCQVAAEVDRTCMVDADCVAVTHQTDYIGQVRLLGIRSSEMAHFAALEMACHPTMKNFSLPAIIADDGSLVSATTKAVTCAAGLCTTFSPACAHPCASGHICITCGTGANVSSVCSQDCTMGSCTEAPRTSCLGGTDVNGGEGEFCFDPAFAAGFMSTSCHR